MLTEHVHIVQDSHCPSHLYLFYSIWCKSPPPPPQQLGFISNTNVTAPLAEESRPHLSKTTKKCPDMSPIVA